MELARILSGNSFPGEDFILQRFLLERDHWAAV